MTNLQYELRIPQKTIGEPQYTTVTCLGFFDSDVGILPPQELG